MIKEDNPFPGICGRICNHQLRIGLQPGKARRRCQYSRPEEIRDRLGPQAAPGCAAGGCPASIADRSGHRRRRALRSDGGARSLQLGYPVTVFEALPVAGGMLRVGIPEFRLPDATIEREVQDILDLGVELRLNSRVENLDNLFNEGYRAVLVAVGAHEGMKLPVPGADLQGVMVNTRFLREAASGQCAGYLPARG